MMMIVLLFARESEWIMMRCLKWSRVFRQKERTSPSKPKWKICSTLFHFKIKFIRECRNRAWEDWFRQFLPRSSKSLILFEQNNSWSDHSPVKYAKGKYLAKRKVKECPPRSCCFWIYTAPCTGGKETNIAPACKVPFTKLCPASSIKVLMHNFSLTHCYICSYWECNYPHVRGRNIVNLTTKDE